MKSEASGSKGEPSFQVNFHIRFAPITQIKNVREPQGELGRVESDVMLSLHFTENHRHCLQNYPARQN